MATPQELLAKIDAEVLAEVDALVAASDAAIKEIAQAAYDAAVQAEIEKIKGMVEVKYETARKYLLELIPQVDEAPIEETADEAVEEDAQPVEVEQAEEAPTEVQ